MSKVFVLDTNKQPLQPCHASRARQLLKKGKASVYKRYPFTIILHYAVKEVDKQPLRLKFDPGSKITGLAIINNNSGEVIFAAELKHRGEQIKSDLERRRQLRRGRRSRKTRHRPERFDNRRRSEGWLPPSLMSRVYNIETWTNRLRQLCPITAISVELAKFDTQKMRNPKINGVEYQQGTLYGYEVKQYLLEKYNHTCVYCGKTDVPLEVEHIIPKSREGGTNRIDNLIISCVECNRKKNNQTAVEFGYPEVQKQAKKTLKDAAAINSTRWEIYRRLKETDLPVEIGTGGRTKFNRVKRDLPKTHWIDAVCVGELTPNNILIDGIQPQKIEAVGHGNRQMCRMDKYGFPRTKPKQFKRVKGFQTGDIVKAVVTKGKKKGIYEGKVSVRASGYFNIKTKNGIVQGISHRFCTLRYRADGYNYS